MKWLYSMSMLLALSLTTSCYRMPEEGEVSVVPVTNNPSVTRQPSSPFNLPGMNQ